MANISPIESDIAARLNPAGAQPDVHPRADYAWLAGDHFTIEWDD